MWYKYASAEKAFNTLADQLLETKIKRDFWYKNHTFPGEKDLIMFKKRAYNYIKFHYGSLWDYRNENMERKVQTIIDEIKIVV